MSLSSTNIKEQKKLSIKGAKLQGARERSTIISEPQKTELRTPKEVEKPLSIETVNYNKLVDKNSALKTLSDKLELLSPETGYRIGLSPKEVEAKRQEEALYNYASKILEVFEHYSKVEIVDKIIKADNVTPERALSGFIKMLESGVITQRTNSNKYYLLGSLPY